MALGSAVSRICISCIDIFFYNNDIGTGTVLGGAVCNLLVITGFAGLFASSTPLIPWRSVVRDSVFYVLTLGAILPVILDRMVSWYEGLAMIALYTVYAVFLANNRLLMKRMCPAHDERENAVFNALEEDYADSVNSFNASINSDITTEVDATVGKVMAIYLTDSENYFEGPGVCVCVCVWSGGGGGGCRLCSSVYLSLGDSPGPRRPLSCWQRALTLFACPITIWIHFTIPDCSTRRWERYYPLTYVCSLIWIGVLSWSTVLIFIPAQFPNFYSRLRSLHFFSYFWLVR
jgi:Ca2+/Na+ antiporter